MKTRTKYNIPLMLQVFLLILISVSPVVSQTIKIGLTLILLLFNIVDMFIHRANIEVSFVLLIILLLFSAVLDIRNVVNGQSYSLVNMMYPVYFACGYVVVQRYDRNVFLMHYEQVVVCFAILSLIGMLVYYINPLWIYRFPTYSQNGATHHTVFFFNYLFSDGWMSVRNSGVAWEPGLFQLLLNIALQISIKNFLGRKRLIRVGIYLVAIVLTRSTAGYIIMFINILTLLKEKKIYTILLAISMAILWVSISKEVTYQLHYKLMGSSAFAARYEPLVNAIKLSWNRPFGVGSTGYDGLLNIQRIGSFDSYTQILIRYGYPVLLFIIGRLVKIFKENEKGIALIIAIGLWSEPVWGCPLIAAFLFLKKPRKNNKLTLEIKSEKALAGQIVRTGRCLQVINR